MRTSGLIAIVGDDGTVFVKAEDMAKMIEREVNCPQHLTAIVGVLKKLCEEAHKAAVQTAMIQKQTVHAEEKPLH